MNWVDSAVLGIVVLSAMMAFGRGFVRSVLSIGAWIGAVFIAFATSDWIRGPMRSCIANREIADLAAYAVMFLLGLVVLSVITGMVGSYVRSSVLGGLDRTLGVVYGILRGGVLVGAVYAVAGLMASVGWIGGMERWPDAVREARSLPAIYVMADTLVQLMPRDHRWSIPEPPDGVPTVASELFHARPEGRATGRAGGRTAAKP